MGGKEGQIPSVKQQDRSDGRSVGRSGDAVVVRYVGRNGEVVRG